MKSFKKFRSNGKLLLTAEYAVLDGALSLAVPTRLGQSLHVHFSEEGNNKITWLAYKNNGELWFQTILDLKNIKIKETNNLDFSKKLLHILVETQKISGLIFKEKFECKCKTQLEFPENWGLGSSSTLINNISKWAKSDPYQLLAKTFGGSGYDIACANAEGPITYQLKKNLHPIIKEVIIPSKIKDNLLFVYLNRKQNSREGIQHYKQKEKSQYLIETISGITKEIIDPNCSFNHFKKLMEEHEKCISQFIKIETVKEKLFRDYPGLIKSLGAWGGDFIMVEKIEESDNYFKNKGYRIIKKYEELLF